MAVRGSPSLSCRRARRVAAGLPLVAALATAGCAASWVEDDGTRRVVGLVDLRITPTADDATLAGEVVQISTLGLGVHADADGTSVSLGWSRHVSAAIRDHSLVVGDPLAVDAAVARTAGPPPRGEEP